MRRTIFFFVSIALASPSAAQRLSLGTYFNWGGFQEKNPLRCFAMAEPEVRRTKIEGRPFASVTFWPGRTAGAQLHVRLHRPKRPGSAVLLRIDDRTWQLAGGGVNAWAPNPSADAEIVQAMRTGMVMLVETRSEAGGRMRDRYQLRGAATAIDAAAVACARR